MIKQLYAKLTEYCVKLGVFSDSELKIEKGCSAKLPMGMLYSIYDLKRLQIPDTITEIGNIFMQQKYKKVKIPVKDQNGHVVCDDYGRQMFKSEYVKDYVTEKPDSLTIYCEPGSVAMSYARDNSYDCAKYE